jgi:hypothetical protein
MQFYKTAQVRNAQHQIALNITILTVMMATNKLVSIGDKYNLVTVYESTFDMWSVRMSNFYTFFHHFAEHTQLANLESFIYI